MFPALAYLGVDSIRSRAGQVHPVCGPLIAARPGSGRGSRPQDTGHRTQSPPWQGPGRDTDAESGMRRLSEAREGCEDARMETASPGSRWGKQLPDPNGARAERRRCSGCSAGAPPPPRRRRRSGAMGTPLESRCSALLARLSKSTPRFAVFSPPSARCLLPPVALSGSQALARICPRPFSIHPFLYTSYLASLYFDSHHRHLIAAIPSLPQPPRARAALSRERRECTRTSPRSVSSTKSSPSFCPNPSPNLLV